MIRLVEVVLLSVFYLRNSRMIEVMIRSIIVGLWVFTGTPVYNNLIGLSIVICGLSILRAENLKVLVVIFCLLFIYDIFWVFFSESIFPKNVMVTVTEQNFTASAVKGVESVCLISSCSLCGS